MLKLFKRAVHHCITGIGNPEPPYQLTRHNAGLLMVDLLKREMGGSAAEFVPCIANAKVKRYQTNEVLLLRADGDYINLSGKTVVPLWRKLGSKFRHLVVHDELSLPVGKVQLRKPGTSLRGHNGLRDISKYYGDDFYRLAVGIGRPHDRDCRVVADYVLSKFDSDSLDTIADESLEKSLEHIRNWMKTR
ncbi:LAMI_0G15346g1_1 [Lachancea mirantina]|uniref:Peptidyl-tRNA hydrolase n=1 Tax=Lachancea mirantina TaxID=1230905 RepID=A0A1G4KCC1_9SACH|nr:LAMI_0G15346g1_1 [Lachancea mirantina]